MLYYKNVINGELAGLTESPYELSLQNFFQITKEEYLELGGYITPDPEPVPQNNSNSTGLTDALISALID